MSQRALDLSVLMISRLAGCAIRALSVGEWTYIHRLKKREKKRSLSLQKHIIRDTLPIHATSGLPADRYRTSGTAGAATSLLSAAA